MQATHRVRRLRWQASAPAPADAFALRSLLRERGDAVQAALEREFARAAPAGQVWHLPRLVLNIAAADLKALDAGLVCQVEAALREALAAAGVGRPSVIGATPLSAQQAQIHSTAPDTPLAVLRPSTEQAQAALRHYLASGALPWTLAGLAPESARKSLEQAAALAVHAVLREPQTLAALVPEAAVQARIGAFVRWLRLLPADARRRWLTASRPPSGIAAALARVWRQCMATETAECIEWQALWLAWPATFAPAAQASAAAKELRRWLALRRQTAGAPDSTQAALASALHDALGESLHPSAGTVASPTTGRAETRTAMPLTTSPAPLMPAQRESPPVAQASDEALLVPLAGLVLLHPFLPRLLAGCGVLDASGRAIAERQLPRACALLHALAHGDAQAAEYELPLVKLLLGGAPAEPLHAAIPRLASADQQEVHALLGAVREHWTALRGTGTDGLRLSFLQRRGLLRRGDGAWQLHLQTASFDLLLGLLPWSIGLVKLPWMALPLVVEWPTP